jgi:uncharacterized integral membrane protein (TIGR00697 family)
MAAFVAVLLCSNLIGPGKVCRIGSLSFGAGNVFFPISYIFGDVLTEVYGFARSRKVIWAGFGALVFAAVMEQVVLAMPVDPGEPFNRVYQPAIDLVFAAGWRIVAGSMLAFWAGDFANSFVLAKLKVLTRGRHLWLRFVASTVVGQGVDSLIFYPTAFLGIWSSTVMAHVVVFNWFFKVSVEIVMIPVTYFVVLRLKRAEGVDFFDDKTRFTPFSLSD